MWSGPLVDFRDFSNIVLNGQETIEVEFTINSLPIFSSFNFSDLVLNHVRVHLFIEKVSDEGTDDF